MWNSRPGEEEERKTVESRGWMVCDPTAGRRKGQENAIVRGETQARTDPGQPTDQLASQPSGLTDLGTPGRERGTSGWALDAGLWALLGWALGGLVEVDAGG